MEKTNKDVTITEHIAQITAKLPANTRVSFELRVKWDKKQQDYVCGADYYGAGQAILLRFSVTTPKEKA